MSPKALQCFAIIALVLAPGFECGILKRLIHRSRTASRLRGHETDGQSPIAIETSLLSKAHLFHEIGITNLNTLPESISVVNDGHTIRYFPHYPEGQTPTIQGGPISGTFVWDHAHFHWGHDDTVGSEHTLDGKRFPLEMHVLFYNNKFTSSAEASSQPNGLVVMGFFFDVDAEAVDFFSRSISTVEHADTEAELSGSDLFSMSKCLP